jgi:adenylate kinase
VPHLATGDLYRAERDAGTELGLQVGPLLDGGHLVPDDITIPLVRREIEAADGFVLDGYPRNLAQAEALDEMLEEIDRPLSIILLLQTDDSISRERLAKRAKEEGRADDTPEAINRRLADYHEKTEPVVEHYRASGNLVQVHAERSIDDVWDEIARALEQVEARA